MVICDTLCLHMSVYAYVDFDLYAWSKYSSVTKLGLSLQTNYTVISEENQLNSVTHIRSLPYFVDIKD